MKRFLCCILFLILIIPKDVYANANNPANANKNIQTLNYKSIKKIPKKIKLNKGDRVRINIKGFAASKKDAKNNTKKILKLKPVNKKILSVNKSGILKAKKAGKTKLKIYVKSGKKWKLKKKFSVYIKPEVSKDNNKKNTKKTKEQSKVSNKNNSKNDKPVKEDIKVPTSLTLNYNYGLSSINSDETHKEINLRINSTSIISHTILPEDAVNKNVVYEVDDTSIISLDDEGLITALKPGRAKITCTSVYDKNISDCLYVNVCEITSNNYRFIAHRGASELAPENSRAAYTLACNYDYYGIECDVHMTKDGVFVLNHDESLKETYGIDIDIKDITYDEIKDYKIVNANNVEEYPNETIPTIDDYLKIIKNSNKCAVIELKNVPTYEDLVRLSNIVDSYELDGRVEFISFAANMLKQMKDIYDEKELENSPSFTFLSITPSISLSNLDGLMPYEWAIQNNMNFGCFTMFITKELSEMMHSNNLGLFSFTIENYYTAYEQLSLYGVDAIAINDPLLMD